MSKSRFKQFAISDSDEDSADEEVISRREKRSATDRDESVQSPVGGPPAATTPPAVASGGEYSTEGHNTPAATAATAAQAADNASSRAGATTPRTPTTAVADVEPGAGAPEETNRSSLSFRIEGTNPHNVTEGNSPQRNLTEGQSIKFDSVPPTPGKPEPGASAPDVPPSRASAIPFRSGPATPKSPRMPHTPRGAAFAVPPKPPTPRSAGAPSLSGSARPAPPVPARRGPGSADARVASAPPGSAQKSRASTPKYALDDDDADGAPEEVGTPKGSDGERRKKRVVRKRVATRRKRGGDPNSASGDGASEGAIAPGRTGSPAPAAGLGTPPPPLRVPSRAQRAASSRANTPRSGSVEAGPRPVMPSSRGASPLPTPRGGGGGGVVERKVTPLIPGRPRTADATPRSIRSSTIQIVEEDEPTADRASERRSVSARIPKAETPRSAAGNKSPGTLDFAVEEEDATSISFQFATSTSRERVSAQRAHAPQVPSASALATPRSTYEMDDEGNAVRVEPARVRQQVKPDGTVVWVFVGEHRDDANPSFTREISAPPKKLSQRAQDIMAAKRRAVEQNAKKRHTAPKSARRPRQRYNFPATSYFGKGFVQRHVAAALAAKNPEWTVHRYDNQASCKRVAGDEVTKDVRLEVEQLIRAVQPIQVGGSGSGSTTARCSCVKYAADKEAQLGEMLRDAAAMDEGFKRYLNLQPMQLANVDLNDLTDPHVLESPSASRQASTSPNRGGATTEGGEKPSGNQERGVATLGGLWCSVEALREDGRPVNRKDAKPPRRVMRVCGGPALGLPLKEEGQSLDVRCYELLLFPQESVSPAAVNYGSEGVTLGQLISPPASSFPLTPRIVNDPIQLKEYKKRLLATKPRAVAIENSEDDRLTFFGPGATPSIAATPAATAGGASAASTPKATSLAGTAGPAAAAAAAAASKYLTITLVTLNSRQKYTVDLTLVLLPYRTGNVDGGKTLAEIPRFCPFTVAASRRLQGLSLSFSTKSAFMSAYRSLLWATECNIIDIQPTAVVANPLTSNNSGLPYMNLRVSATPCPLLPWSSSTGKGRADVDPHDTFHGNCVDFAVITLSASPTFASSGEPGYRDPLTLDDFVIEEYNGAEKDEDNAKSEAKSRQMMRRRSSIYTSTLAPQSTNAVGASADGTTVVGLTAFGVIRRAVNQKTSEVFDVRVIPRNRARMCPAFDEESQMIKTAKMEEEQLLQQDVEAAITMEYTSRLPFQSRVYGVLVDEQRYYVFQEPWISALALEQSATGSSERKALDYNPILKSISDRTSVMSLKEFIHGVLRPDDAAESKSPSLSSPSSSKASEESKLQIAQVLMSQLLLLITSLHGKGMLLGPCPPHRLLVRVETPEGPVSDEAEDSAASGKGWGKPETAKRGGQTAAAEAPAVTSKNVQLCVLDLGVNTHAWSFERQQCGVLEYVSPSYAFEYMLGDDIGKESRAWTMRDDWWSFLCICFELLAADGSALVKPKENPLVPTPTPIISKFSSPVDILNIWKETLTNKAITGNTVSETVAARVQSFVRARVLESISPMLDSWISNKADELEFFGTTASGAGGKRRKGVGRAVPAPGGTPSKKMIGVSLASMYFRNNRDTPSNASDVSDVQFVIDDAVESGPVENILKEMPWLFYYRELFDSILDVVFPHDGDVPCAVHGPSAHLLSHPFFSTLDLGQVFDGTQPMPPAAAHTVRMHMTKAKIKEALLKHRTSAYRGPIPKRPEYPLMITGSAFNMGSNNGAAPLLMLTSPAHRDEPSAREMDGDPSSNPPHDAAAHSGHGAEPQEGLVSSPTQSPLPSVLPSPRAHSPGAGGATGQPQRRPSQQVPWARQARLRSMYKNDELQSIAQLENEVRGALYSHTARDSVSRREMDIPPTMTNSTNTPRQSQTDAPQMSITNESGAAQSYHFPPQTSVPARTTSMTSSRRRDPNEYQPVSARSSVMAPSAHELRSDRGGADTAASQRSDPAPYQQTTTNPFVDASSADPAGGGMPHSPNPSRAAADPGLGDSSRRSRDGDAGSRIDYNEIERSLNELAAGPRGASRNSSSVFAKSAPSAAGGEAPRSTASNSGRWPNEFLGTANLEKKGTPMKLSDPLLASAREEQLSIPRGSHAAGGVAGHNTPRGAASVRGKPVHMVVAKEPHRRQAEARRASNNDDDDESAVLVPSDEEGDSGAFVAPRSANRSVTRGSTYQSSAASRNTPKRKRSIPAWRRASADDRDSYFEF